MFGLTITIELLFTCLSDYFKDNIIWSYTVYI